MPRALLLSLSLSLLVLTTTRVVAQDDDLDVLLDRLVTYLESYESRLGNLIADERYDQEERRRPFGFTHRRTEAEVMFLHVPGEAEWFGLRDIQTVDGKAVKGAGAGATLQELLTLSDEDFVARAAAMVAASAQHVLGARRTLSMPIVPLVALSARNHARYVFALKGRSRIGDVAVRRLEFHEFDEPTLMSSPDGQPLWVRGAAWVEIATGALWRAELVVGPNRPGAFRRRNLESEVRVDFVRDPGLGMLVPKVLVERFWIRGGSGHGRGQYTNFRKYRR